MTILVFILTVIVEVIIGLFFGFRRLREIAAIILVNLITNPALNYILSMFKLSIFTSQGIFTIIILEALVIIAEYLLLRYTFPYKETRKLLTMVITMNVITTFLSFALTTGIAVALLGGLGISL